MLFWNMKYLFYNCQLLLLCCACCKFAIQAFVHEDRHAIQPALAKNCQFYQRVYRRTYTRQYFTESCKQNYGLLPQLPTGIPTTVYLSVFHRELQTKQPFSTITDGYTNEHIPVSISQRVAKQLRHFATITYGYTDGHAIISDAFSNEWRTIRSARLSEFTDGFADERGKNNARVFWRTISDRFPDGFRKIWRDFWNFCARIN